MVRVSNSSDFGQLLKSKLKNYILDDYECLKSELRTNIQILNVWFGNVWNQFGTGFVFNYTMLNQFGTGLALYNWIRKWFQTGLALYFEYETGSKPAWNWFSSDLGCLVLISKVWFVRFQTKRFKPAQTSEIGTRKSLDFGALLYLVLAQLVLGHLDFRHLL